MKNRKLIDLKEGSDPYRISIESVTHSFMMVPKQTSLPSNDSKPIIDKVQSTVNPVFWRKLLAAKPNIPTYWLTSSGELVDLLALVNALKGEGVSEKHSYFIRTPVINLGRGVSQSTVLIGFAFTDTSPKLIISEVECLPLSWWKKLFA